MTINRNVIVPRLLSRVERPRSETGRQQRLHIETVAVQRIRRRQLEQ